MIGRTLGPYRILGHLGGGGMGVVYKAEDTRLGRSVALKLLPPELTRNPDAKRRFEREARAASLLDHPNICTLFDFGESEVDGQMYIAMPCYDGDSLASRVARGPLSLEKALPIVEQICRGLGKAHAAGIVHRDIKPANVMLTADGVVKILDFGLAKVNDASLITQSNHTLGTLAYMAPEQLLGEPAGPPADLWSLGVVLFELLSGERPFRGESTQAVAYSILNDPSPSIGTLPEGSREIDRIIRKLLRKDPMQRYTSAEELLAELESLHAPASGNSHPRGVRDREPLRIGARLGPYEIVEPIGSGGMGDVYRARDTRLDRQVAIKVLAPEFSEDSERRQRFQREAKTISSLSHPNICTLFDVGEQEGIDYLVMEYLEGETLAERLARGPLPLGELLKTGIQIAEALGRAHQQGVIHRDLKPANVILTATGVAKLVDFGLAKGIASVLEESDSGSGRRRRSKPVSREDPTAIMETPASPSKPLTDEGVIIGTLPYMAPEQVEGREADARSDIFSLGVILYEMATGRRAFEGTTKASLVAAILEREPPPIAEARRDGSAPGSRRAPSTIEHIVRRCIDKDPERRWQSAVDVANELRWVGEVGGASEASLTAEGGRIRKWQVATFAFALLFAAAIGAALWLLRASEKAPSVMAAKPTARPRLKVLTWETGAELQASMSPDGASFIYTSFPGRLGTISDCDILLRRVGGENTINLTKDCPVADLSPEFSPDGDAIAFRSDRDGGGIFLMGATGESVRRLTDFGYHPSWSPDGKRIALSTGRGVPFLGDDLAGSLWVVDVASGARNEIQKANAAWPLWSPSGKWIVYTSERRSKAGRNLSLWMIPATGGEPIEIETPGGRPIATAWSQGWLWFHCFVKAPASLWRIRVDETTGKTVGDPELVIQGTSGSTGVSLSRDGRKAIFTAESGGTSSVLTWQFDRVRGRVSSAPRTLLSSGLSYLVWAAPPPGGEWMATLTSWGITLIRLSTGETRDLGTGGAGPNVYSWAPDGSRLYFFAAREGTTELWLWAIRPDGSGRERILAPLPAGGIVGVLASPDGRTLYVEAGKQAAPHLVDVSVPEEQRKPLPLPPLREGWNFNAADWSHDGRWLVGFARHDGTLTRSIIYLFDMERRSYRTLAELEGEYDCAWLPDSRRLLVWDYMGEKNGELRIVDRESGAITSAGSIGRGFANIRFARDGRALYGNTWLNEADIWMLDYEVKGEGSKETK